MPDDRTVVGIVPIQDRTGDPELGQAEIGRILTDMFIQALTDDPSIYVASPNRLHSMARAAGRDYAETGRDLDFARQVCRRAQANALLHGQLDRLGDTYILSAQLTDLDSETVLASFRAQTANRSGLLPELNEQLATVIRERRAARAAPTGADREQPQPASASIEAYRHFVRGYDLAEEGRWQEAVPELKRAVAIDPAMALAWSELSCAYSFAGDEVSARAAHRKAEDFLDRVNEKERRWIEMNGIWVTSGDPRAYREAAEAFIRDFPDDREGYFYLGLGTEYLAGDCEEALASYERAYALTPSFYPVTDAIVDCCLKLERRDEALAALERYLRLPTIGDLSRQKAENRRAAVAAGRWH